MSGRSYATIIIHIFQHLISSTILSDLYGLMQHILQPIFIEPHYNVTVTLVQH